MLTAFFLGALVSGRVANKSLGEYKDGGGSGFAFQQGCALRSGFSFANIGSSNECLSQAVQPVQFCKNVAGNVACKQTGTSNSNVYWHSGMVNTTQGFSDLVSAGISAEGSGWGVSASASVQFTSGHQSASNAVSFYIGAAGSFSIDSIENPSGLKLNSGAASLVKNGNWDRFFQMYGTHYVHSIEYGGSFIGNIQIQSNSEASSFGISTAISGSYGEGPFSVGGSVNFGLALKKMASTTKQTATAQFTGGSTQTFNPQNPKEMGEVFNQWWANVQKPGHGKKFKMYIRSLMDVDEIKDALATAPERIVGIFQQGRPSSLLTEMISKEWAMTNMELNTLKSIKQLPCFAKSAALGTALTKIESAMQAHLLTMERYMTTELLFQLDQDILHQNHTWFVATNLLYKRQIEEAVQKTKVCKPGARTCPMNNLNIYGANFVVPMSWPTSGTDGQGLWHSRVWNMEQCKAVCKSYTGCVAVVLQNVHNRDASYECWLKRAMENPRPATGLVSEAVDCKCYDWNINFVSAVNLAMAVSPSPENCQQLCAEKPGCKFWTWTMANAPFADGRPATGPARCWMKPSKSGTQTYIGAVSGPANCPGY